MRLVVINILMWGTLVPLCVATLACGEANEFAAPPPPTVTVAQPLEQEVVTYAEFTGRTEAVESVEVRARVRGFLETVEFEEGGEVEAGELLYTIEDQEYKAAVQTAEARKARAKAEMERAKIDAERILRLYESNNAAEMEYVNAKANYQRADAEVLAADAALTQAKIDLGYTRITAPIAGRINRTRVNVGNLVGQAEPTVLTTIVPWNPIYVYCSVGERQVLQWRRLVAMGTTRKENEVFIRLADGSDYPLPGKVDYVDNKVDPKTGTLRVRAVFNNPENLLVPGIFVRARVPGEPKETILVPETALQRDLSGYFLMVVNKDNKVERADVETGPKVPDYRSITAGLDANQQVIIKGLQRVRPGITANAENITLPPLPQDLSPESTPASQTQPLEQQE